MQAPSTQEIAQAIDDVEAKTVESVPRLADRLKQAISSAQASSDALAARVKASARDVSDIAVAEFGKTKAHTESAIAAHPWRSVAVIGVAGLLLGALVSRVPRRT